MRLCTHLCGSGSEGYCLRHMVSSMSIASWGLRRESHCKRCMFRMTVFDCAKYATAFFDPEVKDGCSSTLKPSVSKPTISYRSRPKPPIKAHSFLSLILPPTPPTTSLSVVALLTAKSIILLLFTIIIVTRRKERQDWVSRPLCCQCPTPRPFRCASSELGPPGDTSYC